MDKGAFDEYLEWKNEGKGLGGMVVKESEEVREGAGFLMDGRRRFLPTVLTQTEMQLL